MRYLLRLSLFIFGICALLLLVVVTTLDLNRFRGAIGSLVSEAVGRELTLAGPLHLSLGRTLTLSARDVALANPGWAEDTHFLRAESIWIELDAVSLLAGPLVVNEARLSGIDLDLESLPSGEANWVFEVGIDEADEPGAGEEPVTGSRVLVKRLLIEGSQIEYSGPLVDAPLNLALHSVRQQLNEQSELEVHLDASLNDEPVVVKMVVGDYAQLEALGAVSLALSGTAGQIEFSGSAAVDDLQTLEGPRGDLHLHGPSFRYLAGLLNLRSEADGPLQLQATLVDGGDGHRLEVLGRLGSMDAVIRGTVRELTSLADASLTADVSGEDFAGFEVLLGLPPGGPGPFNVRLAIDPGEQDSAQVGLVAEMAGAKLNAEGVLRDIGGNLAGSGFEVRARGASLMGSLAALGVSSAPDTSFETRAVLVLGDGQLVAPEIEVVLGENTLHGSARGMASGAAWSLKAPFSANLAAVAQLLPPDAVSGELPEALRSLQLRGRLQAGPDTSQLEQLQIALAGIDLELGARWPTADPLSVLRLSLRGGGESLTGVVAGLPTQLESPFTVDGELLLDQGRYLTGALDLRAENISLGVRPRADISDPQLAVRFEVEAAVAGSDVVGEVEYLQADMPRLDVALRSDRVDLRPWTSLGENAPGKQQQEVEGDATAVARATHKPRLIPDTDVSGISLPQVHVDLIYRAQKVETDLEYVEKLRVEGRLEPGFATLEEVSFLGQGGGRVRASMGIEPIAQGLEAWLRLSGNNISVGLPAQDLQEVAQLPRYDISLAYVAAGGTVREMAAGSHGYLRMASGAGKVDIGAMRIFTDDFMLELLNTVNPFAKTDKYSNIECSALLAVVEQGELVGEPLLVVRSDRLQVLAEAKIDLGSEAIEADFNTIPMKGLGIGLSNLVNPYVHVRGTLADPSIGLDSAAVLVSSGATVATGGLSILAKGLFDRMSADRQVCATAASAAKEEIDRLEARYGGGRPEGGGA